MTTITAPASATTARYQARVAQARDLRRQLPWNALTSDDFRALGIWSGARARIGDALAEELMSIFTDLEEITEEPPRTLDALGRRIPTRFILRELGEAMAAFFAVAERIDPVIARLEKGLRLMAETPFSEEGDARWVALAELWIRVRGECRELLYELYLKAVVARSHYLKLDEAGKQAAEAQWGPIKDTTRDAHNAMALIKATWPAEHLKRLDEIARQEGIYLIEREGDTPWLTHERTKK